MSQLDFFRSGRSLSFSISLIFRAVSALKKSSKFFAETKHSGILGHNIALMADSLLTLLNLFFQYQGFFGNLR